MKCFIRLAVSDAWALNACFIDASAVLCGRTRRSSRFVSMPILVFPSARLLTVHAWALNADSGPGLICSGILILLQGVVGVVGVCTHVTPECWNSVELSGTE